MRTRFLGIRGRNRRAHRDQLFDHLDAPVAALRRWTLLRYHPNLEDEILPQTATW